MALAPDLELVLARLLVLLDPGRCESQMLANALRAWGGFDRGRRRVSSSEERRTRGVLPPADLDELQFKSMSARKHRDRMGY